MAGIGTIEEDQLADDLSTFDLSFVDGAEFVEKINEIGRLLHMKDDDLFDEVTAFAANMKKTELDLNFLEQFQQAQQKKLQKLEATPSTKKRKIQEFKRPLVVEHDEMNESLMSVSQADENVVIPGKYNNFAPVPNSCPASAVYVGRKNSGKIMLTEKGSKYAEGNSKKSTVSVGIPMSGGITRYGGDKPARVADGIFQRIDDYGDAMKKAHPEIEDFAREYAQSEEEVYVCGMVQFDEESKSEQAISLITNDNEGTVITVEVEALTDVRLFPGQVIVVKGRFHSSQHLLVSQVLTCPPAPFPATEKNDRFPDELLLWCAAGPYTLDPGATYEPLLDLLEAVVEEQPHVLVLVGPFVDRRNRYFAGTQAACTYHDVMTALIERIGETLKDVRTNVFLVPNGIRDATAVPFFPARDLGGSFKCANDNVHVVSDPSSITVCGLSVWSSGTEVISHLNRREIYHSENKNSDRFLRHAQHIVEQRSIYPLLPPSMPSSMEAVLSDCTFSSSPHIVFLPNMVDGFAKNAYGSLIVNPGTLTKGGAGTFAKCHIALKHLPDGPTSIADFTKVDIVKI